MKEHVSWVIELAVKPGQLDTFKQLMEEMVAGTNSEPGIDQAVPVPAGVGVQASVHTACDDETVREGFPEPGRKGEPVLLVECVLELAQEHRRRPADVDTTVVHSNPLSTTWQAR